MKTETIKYYDGEQLLVGEFIYPTNWDQKPLATVILFHAIEGRGDFVVDYAKKIADKGFITFVADMYGNGEATDSLKRGFELITPFLQDRNLVRRRALVAFDTVIKNPHVDKSKVSAIGFCFGGMCVLEVARSGANLYSGITLHGVLGKSDLPTHDIKSKLLILHGYRDPQVPPENLNLFANEIDAAKTKDWTFVFFGHAQHSYTDPKTGTFDPVKEKEMGRAYDPLAAKRAFNYVIEFLTEV